jgi:hypothetical protein
MLLITFANPFTDRAVALDLIPRKCTDTPHTARPLACLTPDTPPDNRRATAYHSSFRTRFCRFLDIEPLTAHGGNPIGERPGEPRRRALRHRALRGAPHGKYAPKVRSK